MNSPRPPRTATVPRAAVGGAQRAVLSRTPSAARRSASIAPAGAGLSGVIAKVISKAREDGQRYRAALNAAQSPSRSLLAPRVPRCGRLWRRGVVERGQSNLGNDRGSDPVDAGPRGIAPGNDGTGLHRPRLRWLSARTEGTP